MESRGWLDSLDADDIEFLKRFLLSSGSLKALATEYDVSYPTIRGRLDRLIAKVRVADDPKIADPFEKAVRLLVADGQIATQLARQLIDAHRLSVEETQKKRRSS